MLDVETAVPLHQCPQGVTLVGIRIVKECNHVTAQVAQQVAQELAYLDLADVLTMKPVVQAEVLANRAHRYSGDDRDLVPLVPIPNDRRLAPRCPSAQHSRDQEEAGFVDEDEIGAQPPGVFFTRGHSSSFHLSISSSSRSMARCSGFW